MATQSAGCSRQNKRPSPAPLDQRNIQSVRTDQAAHVPWLANPAIDDEFGLPLAKVWAALLKPLEDQWDNFRPNLFVSY
jgi:hypothetical protein